MFMINKKNGKFLLAAAVLVFLAAGCGSKAVIQNQNNSQVSGREASNPAGTSSPRGFGEGENMASSTPRGRGVGGTFGSLPEGSRPFFGTVKSVDGSLVILSSFRGREGGSGDTSLAVKVSGSTEISGGIQSDIAGGTRIAGYGPENDDGSIAAEKIQINPELPQGGGSPENRQPDGQNGPAR